MKWNLSKIIVVGVIVIAIFFLFKPVCYWISAEEETITVNKTERINKDGESYYLVFAEEGTYKNVDSWLFWKFNSSDVQGQLETGNTYKVKVAGWRIPLFSSYENIIKIYDE
tara:strand:+ start:21 stop:356 length:336 start_codon:yes stop_codon:yes gene_type:complete